MGVIGSDSTNSSFLQEEKGIKDAAAQIEDGPEPDKTEKYQCQETSVSEFERIKELQGKLATAPDKEFDKFMHSVLDNDKEIIEQGKVLESALNSNVGAFSPDVLFENIVKNYKIAKQIYGKSLIKWAAGYSDEYIGNNIRIPEFQKEIKNNIAKNVKKLKEKNLLANDYTITEKGIELASLIMYVEELDNIVAKGKWGEKISREKSHYGEKGGIKKFNHGERYRNIAIRKTLSTAAKRGHDKIMPGDLNAFERQSRGQNIVIYAIDASGSMKGDKIGSAKKAGIALAYKAIGNKDRVGLIIFGDEIVDVVEPTGNFAELLKKIAVIKTTAQTDIAKTIIKAVEIFAMESQGREKGKENETTKHLLLITDALPTKTTGKETPEQETLNAAAAAANIGITISVIGIGIKNEGAELAKKIVDITKGRFYAVRDIKEVDKVVIEDYEGIKVLA